jgi:hypothetical protein
VKISGMYSDGQHMGQQKALMPMIGCFLVPQLDAFCCPMCCTSEYISKNFTVLSINHFIHNLLFLMKTIHFFNRIVPCTKRNFKKTPIINQHSKSRLFATRCCDKEQIDELLTTVSRI